MPRGNTPSHKKTHQLKQVQAHAFWSGVIAFGLVSLPVSLFPANRSKAVSLRMVDEQGQPLRRQYFCEAEKTPLDREDIVRGYPIEKHRYVILNDDELEALAPEKSREIDLRRFVPLEQINPVYFERGYFLAPESGATKAYRLLAQSMADTGRAGIATFVMRGKEYIVAIMAEDGILRAETLRFHDEIRSPDQVGLEPLAGADQTLVERMRAAMETLADERLDRQLLEDPGASRVQSLVRSKVERNADVVAEPEVEVDAYDEEDNVIDLMQVLRERLQGRSPEPVLRASDEAEDGVASLSQRALYDRARQLNIRGRSKMSREELVEAVKHAS